MDLFYDEDATTYDDTNDVLKEVLQAQEKALQELENQLLHIRAMSARKIRHWSAEEHAAYVQALEYHHHTQARYIADTLGGWTRNQVATHSQKFMEKVAGRVRHMQRLGMSVDDIQKDLNAEYGLGPRAAHSLVLEFMN